MVQVWLKIPSPFCTVGACPAACHMTCFGALAELAGLRASYTTQGDCTEISSSPALSLNLLVTPSPSTKIFTPSYLVLQYCWTSRIPLLMNRTSCDGDIANSESLQCAIYM